MAARVAGADNTAMRPLLVLVLALALVPAALSADPHTQTISGVVTANTGSSLTISAPGRSLTCVVPGAKAQAALLRWGTGVQAAMACKNAGNKLMLTRLSRKDSKDAARGGGDTTTTTHTTTEPTHTTTEPVHTTTEPVHTTTEPTHTTTEPTERKVDARGKVTALGSGAITVLRPDGSSLTCSITDGQLHSIQQGAPAGSYVVMVCGGTGDHPALISLERIDTPTTTTAPTTTTTAPADNRQAIGIVTALSSDGVTVKPSTGDGLSCRITAATDSRAAAAKLTLGARVGIVCRRDGDSYVLSGATSG
jgi:hypothetical protein